MYIMLKAIMAHPRALMTSCHHTAHHLKIRAIVLLAFASLPTDDWAVMCIVLLLELHDELSIVCHGLLSRQVLHVLPHITAVRQTLSIVPTAAVDSINTTTVCNDCATFMAMQLASGVQFRILQCKQLCCAGIQCDWFLMLWPLATNTGRGYS